MGQSEKVVYFLDVKKSYNFYEEKLFMAVSAVCAGPVSNKPCQDEFDKCLAEISTMGEISAECEQMPWCDADGYYFQGPVCDGTCKCLDRVTGEVSVSSEGYSLETSLVLPDEVFNSNNRLDCSLFTKDQDSTA